MNIALRPHRMLQISIVAILLLAPTQHAIAQSNAFHPPIPLLNSEGERWQKGDSVSETNTCGQCHNTEMIHQSLDSVHRNIQQTITNEQRLLSILGIQALPAPHKDQLQCLGCHNPEAQTQLSALADPQSIVSSKHLTLQNPTSEACGQCHGLVQTHLRSPLSLPARNINTSLFGLTGEIYSAQAIRQSALNLKNKDAHTFSFDSHAQRVLACSDCHASPNNPVKPHKPTKHKHLSFDPRTLSVSDYLQQPSHNFSKARPCESCHNAEAGHQWLPFLKQHLNTLSCESCHSNWIAGPAFAKLNTNVSPTEIEWRGINQTVIEGYQPWFLPNNQGKLSPYNIIEVNHNQKVFGFAAAIHHNTQSKGAIRECLQCHNKNSILLKALPISPDNLELPDNFLNHQQPQLASVDIYVVGANTVPFVDSLGIALLLLTLATVIAHGGARYLAYRRHGAPTDKRKRVYMYSAYERLWHGLQAVLILLLLFTGAVIHKPWLFSWLNFAYMVQLHNVLGFILLVNAALALFYHLASGEIKQYIPMPSDLFVRTFEQLRFYTYGIFHHAPHPFEKRPEHKLNPLQKIAYFGLLNILLPAQMLTGLGMWSAQHYPNLAQYFGGLIVLGPLHSFLAWLFLCFLIFHIYLTTTTGPKPTSGIKAMIDGWEDVEV